MHRKLKEIAEILPGYAFRGAIKPDFQGSISVFQAKDLTQKEFFDDTASLVKTQDSPKGNTGYLRKNDIVIAARGMKSGNFKAMVFLSDDPTAVASSSIHIIRLGSPEVLPEYLCNYLNSNDGQKAIADMVTGSYIGALPRKSLMNMEIPIIPFERQQIIVSLNHNIHQQQKLLDRKKEINKDIINGIFTDLTK